MESCSEEIEKFPLRTVIICGFILLVLCCSGLIGNVVCVTVLIGRYFSTSVFRVYFSALCIADSTTLLSCLFMLSIPIFVDYLDGEPDIISHVNYLIVIAYPFGVMAESASAMITALISLVRYLSIRWPLKYGNSNRPEIARGIVGLLLIISFLLNFPRFLEMTIANCVYQHQNGLNYSMQVVKATSMRQSHVYKLYYMSYTCTSLMFVLPFIIVLVCNFGICRLLKTTMRAGGMHTNRHGGATIQSEAIASKLIVVICLLFILCNSLPYLISIFESHSWLTTSTASNMYSILVDISNLLIAARSSSNFLLYLLFNQKFRRSLAHQLEKGLSVIRSRDPSLTIPLEVQSMTDITVALSKIHF